MYTNDIQNHDDHTSYSFLFSYISGNVHTKFTNHSVARDHSVHDKLAIADQVATLLFVVTTVYLLLIE